MLDLRQDVRAEQYRLARLACFAHHRKKLALHQGVKSAGWLVKNQQFRPVHEGLDQAQFLPVAFRQGTHRAAEVEAQAFGQCLDPAWLDRAADLS